MSLIEPETLPTLEPIECSFTEHLPETAVVVTPTNEGSPSRKELNIVPFIRQLTRDITLDTAEIHGGDNNAPQCVIELRNAVNALKHQSDLHIEEASSVLVDLQSSQREVEYWKQRALRLEREKAEWVHEQESLQQTVSDLHQQRKLLKSSYKKLQHSLDERSYVVNALLWHEEHLKSPPRSRNTTATTLDEFETVADSSDHSDSLSPQKKSGMKNKKTFQKQLQRRWNQKERTISSPLIDLVSVDSDLSHSPEAVHPRLSDDGWDDNAIEKLSIPEQE